MKKTDWRTPRVNVSDNLTLVPASLLPFKAEWQDLADSLPSGSTLFVVPTEETPLREIMRRLALSCQERHRPVAAITAERFGHGRTTSLAIDPSERLYSV